MGLTQFFKRTFLFVLSFCVSIYCPLIWGQVWSQDPLENVIATDTIIRTLDNNKKRTEEPDASELDPSSKELIISLQEMEDGKFLAFKREGPQTAELDASNGQALEEIQQVLSEYLENFSGEEQISPVFPQDIMEFLKANGFELTLVEGDHPGRINPKGDILFYVINSALIIFGVVAVIVGLTLAVAGTGGSAIVALVMCTSFAGGILIAGTAGITRVGVKAHDRSIGTEVEEEIVTALQTAIELWWDHKGLEGEPRFSEAFGFVADSP